MQATGDLAHRINHGLEVHEFNERFKRSMDTGNVLFCGVDSIDTRRLIWNAVKDKVDFFSDGRMSAEVLRVLSVCDCDSYEHYPTTLFNADQAYAGPCTAKSTIYSANIAAGLMIAQFTKFLRLLPMAPDISVNLLTEEILVAE